MFFWTCFTIFREGTDTHQNRPVLINVWILAVQDWLEPSRGDIINKFTNNKELKGGVNEVIYL